VTGAASSQIAGEIAIQDPGGHFQLLARPWEIRHPEVRRAHRIMRTAIARSLCTRSAMVKQLFCDDAALAGRPLA